MTELTRERLYEIRTDPAWNKPGIRPLCDAALHYEALAREKDYVISPGGKVVTYKTLHEREVEIRKSVVARLREVEKMRKLDRQAHDEWCHRAQEAEQSLAEIERQSATYDDAAGKDANEQRKRVIALEAAILDCRPEPHYDDAGYEVHSFGHANNECHVCDVWKELEARRR